MPRRETSPGWLVPLLAALGCALWGPAAAQSWNCTYPPVDSVLVVQGTVARVAVDVVGASGKGRVSLAVEQVHRGRCADTLEFISHSVFGRDDRTGQSVMVACADCAEPVEGFAHGDHLLLVLCPVEFSASSHDPETEYLRHRLVVGYCGFVFADPHGAAWLVSPDRPELRTRRGIAPPDSLAARVREILEFYAHPFWRAPALTPR